MKRKQNSKKNLVRVLTLSLLLCGAGGACLMPEVSAATVTTAGTYAGITADSSGTRYAIGDQTYILGIYNAGSTPMAVTVTGNQTISVTDTGLTDVDNHDAYAIGVYGATVTGGNEANPVNISVSASGGSSASASSAVKLYASGNAHGLRGTNTIANDAVMTISAVGGSANSTAPSGYAYATGTASGLTGTNDIGGNATLNISATGGDAHTTVATADANGMAYGLIGTSDIGGNVALNISATGGDAHTTAAKADATGTAYGLNGTNDIGGNATLNISATGGDAYATDANAYARGSVTGIDAFSDANKIGGDAIFNLSAKGGSATSNGSYADAVAEVTGANIYGSTSTVGGNAIFKLNATGGNATATDNEAYASAVISGITVLGVGTAAYTIGGNAELNIKAIGGKSTGADAVASAYASGLRTCMVGSGNLTINGDAIIDVSAIGGTATGTVSTISFATAVGLYVWSFYGMEGGNVVNTITGNVAITAEATATQAGQEFNAYSLCAGIEYMGGGTNDLSSSGTTKTIEGDVYATKGGVNKLVLDTVGSYLQGNIVNGDGTGDNEISVSNGAEWRPVYDNRYGTDCVAYTDAEAATKNVKTYTVATRSTDKLTLSDGGRVNLLWDGDRDSYRTLNISSLAGDAGTFNIKTDLNSETDGDVINVTTGEAGSTQYITVTDASENTGNMVTGNKKLLVATDKSGNYTFTGKTLNAGGLWETTPTIENLDGNNWYLTMIKAEPNPSTSDVIGTVESGYGLWRSTILDDTLRKRLGDLRYEDQNMSGLWARVKAGKLSADTYDSSYQMYQVGMDKKVGNSIYGFVVDHSRNSNTLTSGVGEGSNTGLSLYATNYHDSGAYSDVILRAGKLRTDMHSNGTYKDSFDYNAWGYSASYEVGKTFRKDNGWFVEPQAQLVYGHLAGGDYTTDRGVSVNRDSINSFIGRLGFVMGRQINKNADYYLKANVYREFGGSGDMNLVYGTQKMNYDGGHKDTWFEMGIGTNVKMNNNMYFYGDVLKTFGADIQKKWQVNAGFRWTWGGAKKVASTPVEEPAPMVAEAPKHEKVRENGKSLYGNLTL